MIVLTLCLLVALLIVCGRRGWQIFSSLAGSFLVLLVLIMLIADEFNPLIVTILLAIGLVFLAIYPNTDNQQVKQTATVTTLIMLGLVLLMTLIVVHFSFSQGFSIEDTDEIEQFILTVSVSFPKIQVAVMVLSALGAIAEASIAVSSGVWEIVKYQPDISESNLWQAGLAIGQKIIATSLNTLLFGFFGSYLTLGLWFIQLNYSWTKIFNNAIFVSALLELMISFLGVVGAIYLANYYILRQRRKLLTKNGADK
ncbi:YibE/F family protein [Bombilactobacillus thymidiniphilus]|uniref:YibE/F family protein n=1 Tax=Bombilactobacillus thymidiniphilus TaxID=2923363 RepID=A0ABY4PFI7_9LACO|nr:YibE/F family protein [Bombilactobacillus thymidiniphilus]UQS84283.1 YibE/F family protein [Bombilactobacillus thymidiniphilus]